MISDDKRFQILTNRLIERFFFFSSIIIAIVALSLKEYDIGFIGVGLLAAISYSFGIYKTVVLRRLRIEFDTRLDGLDFEYFKVNIKNKFGDCSLWAYGLLPPLNPRFILNLNIQDVISLILTLF